MIRCHICPHHCYIDKESICQQTPVFDEENTIYTTSIAVDPIEKKPLYHFIPNTDTLSIGTLGCNLKCLNCQNHTIAQPDNSILVPTRKYTPEQIVDYAIKNNMPSISWTYNEPTIHPEWIISTAKIARDHDIKTVVVTNGYSSKITLRKLVEYVDAVNVDIKAMSEDFYSDVCSASLEPVLNSVEYYYNHGVHTEVTNLLIPGYNDKTFQINKLIDYLLEISDRIPLHFTRFYPNFKMMDIDPTDPDKVVLACDLAAYKKIKYVYPGNIPPSHKINTYCKNCRHMLIKRSGGQIENHITSKGACPNCNHKVDVVL
ncbi:MAG: AmmeMemoRadiSam system radical SAM enzyme [Methanosphaera sp.]|nr:AmmeMemoRadiSam system radical SAM enzyme [Methanosphaera sp.]